VLIALAGSSANLLAAEFHPSTGWTTTTLNDASLDRPAVTLTSGSAGLAVIRSTSNGGELRAATWTPGAWTVPAAIPGDTSRASPALTAYQGIAELVFHGNDFKDYFAEHVATWSPTAEPVGSASNQSFGPSPATIAALSADTIVAFAGQNGDLYDQTRTAGAWAAAHAHGLTGGGTVSLSPAITTLTVGGDLMIAYVRSSDSHILSTVRSAGIWSTPAPVDANAFTGDPVSLATLSNGQVLLAYRGQDFNVYWLLYSESAGSWSTPSPLATPNFSTPSVPAIAAGIRGADAELVFIDASTSVLKHARLSGTTWSTPVTVGGSGLAGVGAASAP
jgi:hypothetical protein